MKLFGKKLFVKKKVNQDTHLYDFAHWGVSTAFESDNYVRLVERVTADSGSSKSKPSKPKVKPARTPKEVYNLKMLNTPERQINCDPKYIKEEQEKLRQKLALIVGNTGASKYGKLECASMIERLQNRLRFDEVKSIIEKYPHTTSEAVNAVVEAHTNLRCKEASEFVPDFPDDAIAAMQEYKEMCQSLCGKDPVFYVIADKKDFGEVNKRRDPILLVQSPFGFLWQILGAWDEEMIYLGDL